MGDSVTGYAAGRREVRKNRVYIDEKKTKKEKQRIRQEGRGQKGREEEGKRTGTEWKRKR